MRPADDARTLDDLLRARAEQELPALTSPADSATPPELVPLLRAADRLAAGRAIEPAPAFTQALIHRLEAQVDAALAAGPAQRARARWRPVGPVALTRASLLAAALLLAVGASLLTVARSSAPASPLYGLRRFEQHVRAGIVWSARERVHLHLLYAEQALGSVQQAVREQDLPAYRDALASMLDEDDAAVREAATLPTATDRDRARASVEALRQRERAALHTALTMLGWRDRVATTAALGRIGEAGPAITSVLVSAQSTDGGATVWQVTIGGSGFQPGAMLLVNDQPRGIAVAVSEGTLVANLLDGPVPSTATIGVGNPDGTATETTRVAFAGDEVTPAPTPAAPGATPTAVPTATPEATVEAEYPQDPGNKGQSKKSVSASGINGTPVHGHHNGVR